MGVQVEQHVRIYTQIQTLTGSYDTLAHQASAVNALYMANPPNPLPLFPQYVQPNPYLHSTAEIGNDLHFEGPLLNIESDFASWDTDPLPLATPHGVPSSYSVNQDPLSDFVDPLFSEETVNTMMEAMDKVLFGVIPGGIAVHHTLSSPQASSSRLEEMPQGGNPAPCQNLARIQIPDYKYALSVFHQVLVQGEVLRTLWVHKNPNKWVRIQQIVRNNKHQKNTFFYVIDCAIKLASSSKQKENVKALGTILPSKFHLAEGDKMLYLETATRSVTGKNVNHLANLGLAVCAKRVDLVEKSLRNHPLGSFSLRRTAQDLPTCCTVLQAFIEQENLQDIYRICRKYIENFPVISKFDPSPSGE